MPQNQSGRRIVFARLAVVLLASSASAFAQELPPENIPPQERQLIARLDTQLPFASRELPSPPTMAPGIDLTSPTDDLWLRLRNGYAIPPLPAELVLPHQQWFQNRPEYLRRVVERSRRYLHHILEELEQRGMPSELALLPMVESAFNPLAHSPAQASGLWQFIPATGKRFDLEQNWWHDQRRDVLASTSAALDYLQTIYDMHGDWHLALASYNWGEGAVRRAIQKNQAKGLPTDFANLTMPAETRNYVPKLLALRNIFGNPKLLAELGIPALPNRAYFATYEPDRPIDLKLAARFAGMTVPEFVALNPAHNRPVIKPDVPLVIPADRLEKFQDNLENHPAPLSSWKLYTLKNGDKLEKIAPRFGISVNDLRQVNGLQLRGRLRIAAGQSLLVPARDGNEVSDFPDNIRLPTVIPERKVSRKASGKATIKASSKKPAGKSVAKPSPGKQKPVQKKATRGKK